MNHWTELLDHCVAIDIGARGDIPPHWRALDGHAHIHAFDADPDACARLQQVYAARGHGQCYTVHPVALGAADGERPLYLTRGRGGSSLYKPDTPLVRRYVNADYITVEQTVNLPIRHAGDYFTAAVLNDPDFIKLDVQGAELEILRALTAGQLAATVAVEVEVQFHDLGNGVPCYDDIRAFLTAHGFELYDLSVYHQHPTLHGQRAASVAPFRVDGRSPGITQRVWYGDALFFRTPPADPRKFRHWLAALLLYGFYSEAYVAAEQHPDLRALIEADFRRRRYRRRDGHSLPARLYRWLLRYFDLKECPPWYWGA